jgi:hypothetical protein
MRKSLMKGLAGWLVSSGLWFALTTPIALAANTPDTAASSMPKVGQVAPDFKLDYFDGNDLKSVSLSQYRGKKNVVVAFFVFAFTGG